MSVGNEGPRKVDGRDRSEFLESYVPMPGV